MPATSSTTLPNAKIAVLYQNDDFGKDYLIGLREGLGDKADKLIVATKTYETTDPTVDSQVVALQGSGADVLLTAAIPKFAAQAIRKVYDIGWKPTHFLTSVSSSVGAVMQPAGPEKGIGIISAAYLKEPTDPQWQNTPEYKEWLAWMKKYNPSGNVADINNVAGYSVYADHGRRAQGVRRQSHPRERDEAGGQHPQSELNRCCCLASLSRPAPTDFAPVKQMQMAKFDGTTWQLFGEVISGAGH